jgi:hypothetical protein
VGRDVDEDAPDLDFGKAEYFLLGDWTTQISLNWLGKIDFWRMGKIAPFVGT